MPCRVAPSGILALWSVADAPHRRLGWLAARLDPGPDLPSQPVQPKIAAAPTREVTFRRNCQFRLGPRQKNTPGPALDDVPRGGRWAVCPWGFEETRCSNRELHSEHPAPFRSCFGERSIVVRSSVVCGEVGAHSPVRDGSGIGPCEFRPGTRRTALVGRGQSTRGRRRGKSFRAHLSGAN